jgi:hypothetical protein
MPEDITLDDYMGYSYDIKEEEEEKGMEIARVNPILFRQLQYMVTVSPDTLNPKSTDLERAWSLEDFDRMVLHPEMFDSEETARLLVTHNPVMNKDADKYIAKKPTLQQQSTAQPQGGMPNSGNSPLNSMMGKNPLNKQLSPVAPQV